jgi:hypothetical protein
VFGRKKKSITESRPVARWQPQSLPKRIPWSILKIMLLAAAAVFVATWTLIYELDKRSRERAEKAAQLAKPLDSNIEIEWLPPDSPLLAPPSASATSR